MGISKNELKELGIDCRKLDLKTLQYVVLALKSMTYYQGNYLSRGSTISYFNEAINRTKRYAIDKQGEQK